MATRGALSVAILLTTLPRFAFVQNLDVGHQIAIDLKSGENEEAKALAERALASSPNDARLWTLKGVALAQLQKPTEALECFSRALRFTPDYMPALEGAAQIEYAIEPARAAPYLHRIVAVRPSDPASHAMLAGIAEKRGDCAAAKHEFAIAHPEGGEAAGARALGVCFFKQKQFSEAIAAFKRLTELEPDQDSTYKLAMAQFLAGRFAGTVQTLEPIATSGKATPDTLELLAEAYDFTARPEDARKALRSALAENPTVPDYYTEFAYMCQGHRLFQEGIDVLNSGLARLQQVASLYVARGVLYSELGKWEQGEADFQKATELDPNLELTSNAQGLALLQRNDLTTAELTARERMRRHPRDPFPYYLLADVLAKKGITRGTPAFQESINSARKAVELKPDLFQARDLLGRLYLQSGDLKGAVEQSRAVYQANPNDQTALYHLIVALRRSGKQSELPELLHQLAELKKRGRKQDGLEALAPGLERTQ